MSASRTFGEALRATVSENPVERSVIKATDSEAVPCKRKHVDKLLSYSHRSDVSVQDIVDSVLRRAQAAKSYVVLLKCLTLMHRLLRDSHEKLPQYWATKSSHFAVSTFEDRKTPDGVLFGPFIVEYADYLNNKVNLHRLLGHELCHVRAKDEQLLLRKQSGSAMYRTMDEVEKLAENLIACLEVHAKISIKSDPRQGYVLENTSVDPRAQTNDLFRASLALLWRDALTYFCVLNEGSVKILERYFTLSKTEAKQAFALFERFVKFLAFLDGFHQVCKQLEVDRGDDLPNFAAAPGKILPKMRDFLYDTQSSA